MVKKLLKPWPRRLFLKKISGITIIVTATLIAAIIGTSLYGSNVGSFVISIEESTRLSLTLSESGDFLTDRTTMLSAEGLKGATNTTYGVIPEDIDDMGPGANNDKRRRYTAYTFYMKNTSPMAIGYVMEMKIVSLQKAVDEAIRVMIITNGEKAIYAKPRANGTPEKHLDISVPYETIPFVSATTICSVANHVFAVDEIVKYTVVMWIEGYDEQCVDDIKGGAIKLRLDFMAIS